MTARAFDVIAMGRSGVDIYPLQTGVGLEEVTTFAKFLGGSATNVAVAAARLGRDVAIVTRTGDDPFGRFIHQALGDLGVSDEFVTAVADLPTPVTFCEIFPPDNFPLYFYRNPTAPDLQLKADELDHEAIASARIFWSTVTGLSQEPSRSAHFAAWRTRNRRAHTILDLDYRPMFWDSRAAARAQVDAALEYVTIAIGNLDETLTAVGEDDPHRAGQALLERGVQLAVVKQGPRGVLAMTSDESVEVAPLPIEVLNGLGAGDGFGGALCHGLLAGWSLRQVIEFANAAGAIVATRLECSTAMPTVEEVTDFIEKGNR
ncbi:MAG: 5-dehydro-2-deoxygluconokinase [Acidimicrobiales bacterium]